MLCREAGGAVYAGKLELDGARILLDRQTRRGLRQRLEVPFTELSSVRIGRLGAERIDGRAALVIERRGTPSLFLTDATGVGAVRELADRLAGSTRIAPAAISA
jgi:hypothetical protein